MNPVRGDQFGRIPEGMRWCSHCNGYGSSLKEASVRCTHCGGRGLVWSDRSRAATASPPSDASEWVRSS
jgi:DnaJ-class molecular chaperone